MGWAHLGFWASSGLFVYMIWYVLSEDSLLREVSKRDEKSRLEYAQNPRVWEDGHFVTMMIGLFFIICLFGHLAGSPWADLVAWSESRPLGG